jgi:hypothetical protein
VQALISRQVPTLKKGEERRERGRRKRRGRKQT